MFLCRMRSLCRSGPRSLSCVIKGTGILRAIQTAPCREAAACHLTPPPAPSLTSVRQRRSQHRRRPPFLLLTAAAFSLFSTFADKDQGEDLTDSEENLIYLLKKAKLSIMKGEMEEAEEILHQALHLAQQSDSKRGIIYTYDLMANLAILRGQLESSEKLFKATLVFMLDGGVKQDHISFIEISLKLASIYAAQNQNKLAVAGYQFCIMTLEEKIEKEKDLPVEILAALTAEEKSNTRLLLGLCLDSYGRYLLANAQYSQAQSMYEKALQICKEEQGELHPQVSRAPSLMQWRIWTRLSFCNLKNVKFICMEAVWQSRALTFFGQYVLLSYTQIKIPLVSTFACLGQVAKFAFPD
ncbi:hypothetical protein FKM82_008301 [Ascaphus truei]